jgi:hypothetical protein
VEDGLHAKTEMAVSGYAARKNLLSKDHIVNAINYLHYQNRPLYIVFRHLQYNTFETVKAFPTPCCEDYLHLTWENQCKLKDRINSYELHQVLVETGRCMVALKPEIVTIDDKSISLDISRIVAADITRRKVERWPCRGVDVEMIQNGISFRGTLKDCSGISFSAVMSFGSLPSFTYVHPEINVTVLIKKQEELLYSGECRIIRHDSGVKERTFVLEPIVHHLNRFTQKMHRSPRHRLFPSPNLIFVHPLIGKVVSLKIEEIAGSGFSVIEHYDSSTLLPGMILPQAEIEFAHGVKVSCRAQVMSRSAVFETTSATSLTTSVRCGIAILDMDSSSQTLIASILHQATNKNSYVCNRVDIDELWKFFFKTGFIYPKKYLSIYQNMEKFREIYSKLYLETPDIARHFTYQDNGQILGHISMVRFFENTWLFHHHASVGTLKAGFVVLDQIGRFVNDVFNMYSSHMQYVLCYFRPENRFPNRVFGGYAKYLANPKACSLDDFAYILIMQNRPVLPLPTSFTLEPSTAADLCEFNDYYSFTSGGLLTAAFELGPSSFSKMAIKDIYERNGMKRDRHLFSLRQKGTLKALFIANISDIGLNLSNLTNCVTVFILDSHALSADHFLTACSKVAQVYTENEIPFLVSPTTYAEKNGLRYDKIYRLWSIDAQQTDNYLDYVSHLIKKD